MNTSLTIVFDMVDAGEDPRLEEDMLFDVEDIACGPEVLEWVKLVARRVGGRRGRGGEFEGEVSRFVGRSRIRGEVVGEDRGGDEVCAR